jgi:hypothetical protein
MFQLIFTHSGRVTQYGEIDTIGEKTENSLKIVSVQLPLDCPETTENYELPPKRNEAENQTSDAG